MVLRSHEVGNDMDLEEFVLDESFRYALWTFKSNNSLGHL